MPFSLSLPKTSSGVTGAQAVLLEGAMFAFLTQTPARRTIPTEVTGEPRG